MKLSTSILAITIALHTTVLTGCGSGSDSVKASPQPQPEPTQPQPQPPEPTGKSYQELLEDVVGEDVPGLILRVDGKNTDFLGAAGLSDIEQQTPMEVYHQMPAGSAGEKSNCAACLDIA